MEGLIEKLANLGGVGILAAVLLWQTFTKQKNFVDVIVNNTKAMTELTEIIKTKCTKGG